MTASRVIPNIVTPDGKSSGEDWTNAVAESVEALWALNGGRLDNVAGVNSVTADIGVSAGFTAYTDGLKIGFTPANSNTGASTLNISGKGNKAIVDPDGVALAAGALVAGRLSEAMFFAASDHFRLVTSGGTTNVTVVGGIMLQRSTPSRLAVAAGPATAATSIGSKTFQCQYANSRVVIEGSNSRVTGAGTASVDGTVFALYVDSVEVETYADQCQDDSHSNAAFYFEYEPGDALSHTYEIKVASALAATYPAGGNFLFCSEFSPNA